MGGSFRGRSIASASIEVGMGELGYIYIYTPWIFRGFRRQLALIEQEGLYLEQLRSIQGSE